MKTQGIRVKWHEGQLLAPGQYTKHRPSGTWYGCTPNGHMANLELHEVTRHPDGSITASPSILVSLPDGTHLWHGFLEEGVWRELQTS